MPREPAVVRILYLATLAFIPWAALLPFPWIHENARWSDVLFALACLAGRSGCCSSGGCRGCARCTSASRSTSAGRRSRSPMATPRPSSGPAKLLGLAMLAALFVVTSDLAGRPGMPAAIGKTIAVTSLFTALAALVGVVLSGFGILTPLVGTCGDLLPGPLSRAQAGFPHPNLLANFCVFALRRRRARGRRPLAPLAPARDRGARALASLLTTSRAILAFGLAAAIRHATTPARRRFAWGLAGALVAAMIGLTLVNVTFQPLRPWELRVRPGPSVRLRVGDELARDARRASRSRAPASEARPAAAAAWRSTLTSRR